VGTPTAQAGLAHLQSYIVDRTDGTADAVYAGDLMGNLWRWDLRAATGPYPAPEKIATLTNNAGQAMPVTSRPMVLVHPATNRRYVTVGTGRLLDNSDISASAAQAFVAVIDGTANTFATTAPGGAAFPITRSQLVRHTDLTAPVVVDTTSQAGWWVDLGVSVAGNGWRVITEPSAFYGVVTFVAMLPNTSPCNPSGISRVYSVDVGSGQSQLVNDMGTTIAFSEVLPGVVIEHRTYSVDGKPRLVACNDLGTCQGLRRRPAGISGLRRLNWRELPLAE
jgi:type IV pilus assembly protein PilY1